VSKSAEWYTITSRQRRIHWRQVLAQCRTREVVHDTIASYLADKLPPDMTRGVAEVAAIEDLAAGLVSAMINQSLAERKQSLAEHKQPKAPPATAAARELADAEAAARKYLFDAYWLVLDGTADMYERFDLAMKRSMSAKITDFDVLLDSYRRGLFGGEDIKDRAILKARARAAEGCAKRCKTALRGEPGGKKKAPVAAEETIGHSSPYLPKSLPASIRRRPPYSLASRAGPYSLAKE